jgi:L-seryl-tRNA(Ser) seleniumtransferase
VVQPKDRVRELPSIDHLLHHTKGEALLARYNREHVVRQCREAVDELRSAIRRGSAVDPGDLEDAMILERLERRLERGGHESLRRVVNATGTVLHTNLGRAPLAEAAIEALTMAARHPTNLEYDLVTGERGRREAAVEQLIVDLTGAEAATVVNNNAAAVLIALNTFAPGKEVIVSRGELIEIGGAFRIPDIMASSGASLKEVGTTNRTHLRDYEEAIGGRTALLLKVHPSNYRIVGFSSEVALPQLVALGARYALPVMEDLGSGALIDLTRHGLPKEPVVAERVALGADVVTFSGDKLLGGPQAGVIVGKRAWIERIARNPMHRAMRCGKLTLSALEATLRLYQQSPDAAADIPALKAFTRPLQDIQEMGERALPRLQHALGPGFEVTLEDSTSQVGSGALPTEEIPTKVLAIRHERESATATAARFRQAALPIIGRVRDDRFLLDLRTVFDADDLIPRW